MGSPYAGGSSSGGSAYASGSASASSPYAGGGAPAAPVKKGGGGFLGGIEAAAHWTAGKAELAGHDLKAVPGGLLQVAKVPVDEAKATYELATGNVKGASRAAEAAHNQSRQIVKGTVATTEQAVEHPLRDPFLTLTTLLPALKGLGSAGLRVGAAADTARAGEGAGAVAKAAAAKPVIKPRMIRQGDSQVSLLPSRNEGVRVVQHLYDKVIQHALDTNPDSRIGAHAASRVGGSILETERRHVAMQDTPVGELAQAATKLGPRKLSPRRIVSRQVPRRVQEAALRLTSENNTAEEAAAAHRDFAEQGRAAQAKAATGVKLTKDEQGFAGSVKQNLKQAVFYDRVAKHGLVIRDANGDAVINAADHPHLAAVDAQVAAGQAQVDEIARAHDLMSEKQLTDRKNGPARIRNGATYETPTAAKAGLPSQSLLKQRARVGRLMTLHERALAKASETATPYPNVHTRTGKPVAQSLDELQARHPNVEITASETDNGITLSMIRTAAADRGKGLASKALRDIAAYADEKQKPIALTPERVGTDGLTKGQLAKWYVAHGFKRNTGASKDFRFRETMLRPPGPRNTPRHVEVAPGPRTPGVASDMPAKGATNAITDRLGAALSVERDRLAQMEKAAANRVKPTGIVGGDGAREGRGYVTYRTQEPRAPKGAVANAAAPVVGKAKSFIPKKAFTGEGLQHGKVPDNTTRLVAQHMRDAYRYVNTDRFRRTVLLTGSLTRRSSRDVLVRDPAVETAGKIGPELDNLIGRKNSTLDELSPETMDAVKTGFQAWHQQLVPGLRNNFADDRAAGIGTKAPDGYKWVDRNTLGDLGKPGPGPRGAFARQVDKVNTAVTAATVYFKLGHLGTRFLTNAATNIIQGSAKPGEIGRSLELWKTLTHEERMKALAAAGQHSFNALPMTDETGVISKGISTAGRVGAQWWAKHADAVFRFNSLAYEARKAGFDTPEKFRYLLAKLENPEGLDAAETARIDWVGKRANREAIAYDRLSHFERTYITRAFWFYPWTAAATRFFVNTLLEHPYKSFLIGAFGSQGRQTQQAELGDLPSYEQGLVKLAGGGNNPLVTDLSTFSPLATPADLLQVPSVGSASSYLNPAYAALAQLAFRQNQYGQHSNKPLGDAFSSLFSPTPEAQILNAYLKPPKATSMFHRTPLNMLARAAAGPALPRKVNVTAAHSAAARERSGR